LLELFRAISFFADCLSLEDQHQYLDFNDKILGPSHISIGKTGNKKENIGPQDPLIYAKLGDS